MYLKVVKTFVLSLVLFGTAFATVAYAQGGEGAPSQSPVQVIVQIVVTTIVLKVLARFDLP